MSEPSPGQPQGTFVGIGGIGWGHFFAIDEDRTLGRNESRGARLLDAQDFFKLHIVFHMLAVLTSASPSRRPRIVPIGIVGRDGPGRRLVRQMRAIGIDVGHISSTSDHPTTYGIACQYPDGSGFNIGATNGACATISAPTARARAAELGPPDPPVVAVSLPEVPLAARAAFLEAFEQPLVTRVGSFTSAEINRAAEDGHFGRLDLVAMNEDEAAALAGRPFSANSGGRFLAALAGRVQALNPAAQIVVTAGRLGAFACQDGQWDHCPAPDISIASTAGAGDALLAGVLAGRWAGLPLAAPERSGDPFVERQLASAIDVGVLAASYKVQSIDTIPKAATAAAVGRFGRQLGLDATTGRYWLPTR
jgi:sugar/nucleoside kinase (ribokinase family)